MGLSGRVNWELAWDTCLGSAYASGKSAKLTYFPLIELVGTIPARMGSKSMPGGSYVTPLNETVQWPCSLGIPGLLNESITISLSFLPPKTQ